MVFSAAGLAAAATGSVHDNDAENILYVVTARFLGGLGGVINDVEAEAVPAPPALRAEIVKAV